MKVISVSTIGNLISAHMKKQYLARIQENSEHTFYQPLSEHLQHVSSLIEVNSNWKGMQSAKKLVALLHDGGKVETRFDNAMQKQKKHGNPMLSGCQTHGGRRIVLQMPDMGKC